MGKEHSRTRFVLYIRFSSHAGTREDDDGSLSVSLDWFMDVGFAELSKFSTLHLWYVFHRPIYDL